MNGITQRKSPDKTDMNQETGARHEEMERQGQMNGITQRKSPDKTESAGEFRQTVLTPEQAAEIKRSLPSTRPKRTFQFHMKLVGTDPSRRLIEGYASTRDMDLTGEIVEPGAFADSLKDFMANPVVTYMHDWADPIGKVLDARLDEVGLFIRAGISETAQKVWTLIEEGVLRAFSVGYEVVEEKLIEGANHILRLRLYEVAVVSIPANRRALFSVSKALENGTDLVCVNCANEGGEREEDGPESGESRKSETGNRELSPPADAPEQSEVRFLDEEIEEVHAILKEVMQKFSAASKRQ